MAKAFKAALLGLSLTVAAVLPASAREDYCLIPGTNQIDARATATLRQLMQQTDRAVLRYLSGVWFSRTQNPYNGTISDLYQRFEPNLLYSYVNRVCSGTFCRTYEGIGVFGVRAQSRNQFFGLVSVSDLNRNHQCTSLSGRVVNRNVFTGSGGTVFRRVR